MEIVLLFLFALAFGATCGIIGESKGLGAGKWMVLGFFFGIFALVIVLATPSQKTVTGQGA